MSAFPRRASAALLCVLFLVAIYRAKFQSFTIDEAYTFNLFVDRSWGDMLRFYDAANHVLHTVLTKLFREWLGTSELALRLSSLIGCAVYFTAVYRLTGLVFGNRWFGVLAVAALTLNPLLFDFMVVSRGYGLALGLFAWAFYATLSYVMRGWDTHWLTLAGVFSGLSLAANLTFAVPVAAMGAALFLFQQHAPDGGRFWPVIEGYAGPAFAIAFAFTVLPLLQASGGNFYFGAASLAEAASVLFQESFLNHPQRWPVGMLARNAWPLQLMAGPVLVGVLGLSAGFFYFQARSVRPFSYRLMPFLTATLTLLVAISLTVILAQFGSPYPWGRTGLYFLFLFTVATLTGIRLISNHTARRLSTVVPMLIVLLYIRQFDARSFVEWRFDAGTRRLVERLIQDARNETGQRTVRVAASPLLKETVDYCKKRIRLDWLERLDTPTGAGYLLYTKDEAAAYAGVKAEVLQRDARSGAVLARVVAEP